MEGELHTKKSLIKTALGEEDADLVLKGCNLLNLFTGKEEIVNIGIKGEYIATVTTKPLGCLKELDCSGYYALPGFIDAHVHVESTQLTLSQLAKIILPCGTTTIMLEPMVVAAVCGLKGVKVYLEEATTLPLNVVMQMSSRVPDAPGLETTGAIIGSEEVREMLEYNAVVALGEFDESRVKLAQDDDLQKIIYAEKKNKICVGHAAGISGKILRAFAAAGLGNDHESEAKEEVMERLSLGIQIMVREGSSTDKNLAEIIKVITEEKVDPQFLMFCTDDKQADEILDEGHIDYMVRKAISLGIKPIDAIRMATFNSARYFRIDDKVGIVAPGRRADINLTKSLENLKVDKVICGGKLVAAGGEMVIDTPVFQWPSWAHDTINVGKYITPEDLCLKGTGTEARVRAIAMEGQVKVVREVTLPILNGEVMPDIEYDVLKLICVERHEGSGRIAHAFFKGFGIKLGAIATSFSHEHYNILAIGTNNSDLALAINTIQDMHGGMVVTNGSKVCAKLPLKVAGVMTYSPADEVKKTMRNLNEQVSLLRSNIRSPFTVLSFICIAQIPEVGFSDLGLIDVRNQSLMELFL